jgi:hypothetical protein
VTVTNLVSFPYYYSQVFGQGVGMWVNAQSAVPNVDWEVWVYGSQTNYLGAFGPTNTPNGILSVTWGLQTNMNSAPLTDPTFRLDYYLFSAATGKSLTGGKSATTNAWKIAEAPWTPSGMVVACAPIDDNEAHKGQVTTLVADAVGPLIKGRNGRIHQRILAQRGSMYREHLQNMNKISHEIQIGAVGELLVQARLLQYGVQAAPPTKDSGNNFIAIKGESSRAIQVRTRTTDAFILGPLPWHYDILALVKLVGDGQEVHLDASAVYLIPKKIVESREICRFDDLDDFLIHSKQVSDLFA